MPRARKTNRQISNFMGGISATIEGQLAALTATADAPPPHSLARASPAVTGTNRPSTCARRSTTCPAPSRTRGWRPARARCTTASRGAVTPREPRDSNMRALYLTGAVLLTLVWLLARSFAPAGGLTRSYYYPLPRDAPSLIRREGISFKYGFRRQTRTAQSRQRMTIYLDSFNVSAV